MRRAFFFVSFVAVCGLGSSAARANSMMDMTKASAERQINQFVHTWSSGRGSDLSPRAVAHYYANPALYYGKRLARGALLRDKLRYAATWPERRYRMAPGSVVFACDPGRKVSCRVSGILRYDRGSTTGERATGAARLRLLVTRASGDRIVRESAVFLR